MTKKTLKESMPKDFLISKYKKTKAYQMQDSFVILEHCLFFEQDAYVQWPGKHKNVYFWVELENGYAVGCNENPVNGWSFPVYKL